MHAALKIGLLGLLGLGVADVGLLASGKRVLVSEKLIRPGDRYEIEEHGDLGASSQASLVCRYFTGRSVLTQVWWYASNDIMGRSECPFITTAES